MSDYTAREGAPIWFDLMSSDPDRAVAFYGELFGWTAEPANEEFAGYRNFRLHDRRIAGISPVMPDAGPPDLWSVYLRSDDLEATAAKAEAAGAQVLFPPMEIGDEGAMTFLIDPAGAAIGFWRSKEHPGFQEWGVHGAPYWFDTLSRDYAASLKFYQAVIGAEYLEAGTGGDPEATGPDAYSQVMIGDTAWSGIMDAAGMLDGDTPSFWQVYICVDDVAATVAKAESLGGRVLMPAEVTPFGTLATITDPLGAPISLGHPPAGM